MELNPKRCWRSGHRLWVGKEQVLQRWRTGESVELLCPSDLPGHQCGEGLYLWAQEGAAWLDSRTSMEVVPGTPGQ